MSYERAWRICLRRVVASLLCRSGDFPLVELQHLYDLGLEQVQAEVMMRSMLVARAIRMRGFNESRLGNVIVIQ